MRVTAVRLRALASVWLLLLGGCAVSSAVPMDATWLLAPDPAGDAVRASDTEDSLVARYGAANVTRGYVDEGEGMLVNGTILFPGDSIRQLEVKWADTVARRHPVQVYAVGRGWTIAPGIRLGTTLQELERMNGGPFELSGFRGHYPGTVGDWRSGHLAWLAEEHPDWGNRAMLHLQPEPPFPDGVDLDRYDSEEEFLSSEPGLQRLQPRVTYLAVRPRE